MVPILSAGLSFSAMSPEEDALISVCLALIGDADSLSATERRLIEGASAAGEPVDNQTVHSLRRQILRGADPLGEAFTAIRSADDRRATGAVYTPQPIVDAMVEWLATQGAPVRIVDPGSGSGRFILAAGRMFPDAELVAVEMDPLAALMLRANVAVCGLGGRVRVLVEDYRKVTLPCVAGMTAFIGNPPYVRHHEIGEDWKAWYAKGFAALGIKASALAGLHLHFFLQTRLLAREGDVGAFVTSAEWMDVNYGSALRKLLIEQLGGTALHVLAPTVEAFPGTATTAAITCFRVGERAEPVTVHAVDALPELGHLEGGTSIARTTLQTAHKWSAIARPAPACQAGEIELGELFRVHRGQVTGANDVWIAGDHARDLPACVKFATVTKAMDLIRAGAHLRTAGVLRSVIDLPAGLDGFTHEERQRIDAFLSWARQHGAHEGYIATHRKAWWSVALKAPAPILCTYMARRPPQFTVNTCGARHINIAHGLYPREPLAPEVMYALVAWLNGNTHTGSGRTYAGGLTKFEPREIERLRIPALERLLENRNALNFP